MRFSFDGPRLLNGRRVEFPVRTLYDSPFVRSAYRSGIITMTHGGRTRTLDFNSATITER